MFEALCHRGKQTKSYKSFVPNEKGRKKHRSVPIPIFNCYLYEINICVSFAFHRNYEKCVLSYELSRMKTRVKTYADR